MEVAHPGLADLRVVADMHERKALMASLSDGFIAMPGGLGTLEEIFEALTWLQLGLHAKPCALFNVNAYYDLLISFLNQSVVSGFSKNTLFENVLIDEAPSGVIELMSDYKLSV